MRASLVLIISAAGIGTAQAAPVAPWPSDRCESLAKDIGKAIRMKIVTSVGDTATLTDLAPKGQACLLSADATGLTQKFADAHDRMVKVVAGWAQIPEVAADGPDSSQEGYRKDKRQVILSLERSPPAGTCEDVVQADCKVLAKRWTWRFRGAAYLTR